MEDFIINPNEFLDITTHKVQHITFDQLQRTSLENDCRGLPLRGIYHFDLLSRLGEEFNKAGYQLEIQDMFAANSREKLAPGISTIKKVQDELGVHAVEAHILRRVFANMIVRDFDTDEYTTNLAVAFHQDGIQVGLGRQVKICTNQCMLSPTLYASTYASRKGEEKYSIEDLISMVGMWARNLGEHVNNNDARANKMKQTRIDASTAFRCVGELTAMRVAFDTKDKDIRSNIPYPLNDGQISEFTEGLLKHFNKFNEITLWDFYNIATNLYKADRMNIPCILPQNLTMVEYLESHFGV